MPLNCDPKLNPFQQLDEGSVERFEWSSKNTTRLAKIAARRAKAQQALNAFFEPLEPIAQARRQVTLRAQQYWEQIVFETGHLAVLAPQKTANVSSWIATWLGQKVRVAGLVREPLLNAKRLTDGLIREASVYSMMNKQKQLASILKDLAKRRGVQVQPDDMRRILEEGMIPQRLAVYGNSPTQHAVLMDNYNKFYNSFLDRGFLPDDIPELLNKANEVSAQWDELLAIQKATGYDVGTMYNIGYMPRSLTDEGFATLKLATKSTAPSHELIAKSRTTWRYLPEDHNLAARMMGIEPDDLHGLIANPQQFAEYLSQRLSPTQVDLLVDSGIMSKVPLLTSEVAEYMTRTYKLPIVPADVFIADPLTATQKMAQSMSKMLEESSMMKLIKTVGLDKGWSITPQQFDANRELYKQFVKVDDVYMHPLVHQQFEAIKDISKSPAEMSKLAAGYKMFTRWFSKQAIGNPIGAQVYLTNQFLGNAFTAHGHGVGIHEYVASVIDMVKLAAKGLDGFDNVKPFRIIDGLPVTHREVVARTARMFSRDVLPGVSGADALLQWKELDPRYIMKQFADLRAAAKSVPEYAEEVTKVLERKSDAIFLPTIRMASILDMAGHLSIVRGRSPLAGNLGERIVDGLAQFGLGQSIGKIDRWDDLILEVKRSFPVFDDVGKFQSYISSVAPFTAWSMQNLPLQMRDMMRQPSKWYNYARIHALWNDAQLEGEEIPVHEMQQEDMTRYGMVLRRDAHDKKTYVLHTDNFDPRWGAFTWFTESMGAAAGTGKKSGGTIQDWVNKAIAKSYFNGIYEAASGIDTYTGRRRDDSEFNANNQFAGIAMPPWMAAVLSISPVLSSLDRLPVLSGTKDVLDPRTNAVLVPATQGWLRNKGKLLPNQLQGVEATIQTLGGKVRYIDGLKNMQYTEADVLRSIQDLTSRQRKEQMRLATDVRNGAVEKGGGEYARRLDAINRMTDAAIQLNYDLGRLQLWAIQNKVPSSKMLQEFQKRQLVMDGLPLPGAEYIQESLDNAFELKRMNK
jgi:hypothetical protein